MVLPLNSGAPGGVTSAAHTRVVFLPPVTVLEMFLAE